MSATLYRRPLPEDLVAFSSPEGKRIFREALEVGGMEGWYELAEQFHTQADPAFCGLGSLVVALNALGVDPQRLWTGPWRWFSEELLDCCVALDEVRARGISMVELACLARCNGVSAEVRHASEADVDALRCDVTEAARGRGTIVIAAYTRRTLGQTGDGHFSPLAGIHAARDLTLLLDVARFKYPPHWVPVERLHRAMLDEDSATRRSRGWVVLSRLREPGGLSLSLTCRGARWSDVAEAFEAPLRRWQLDPPSGVDAMLAAFVAEVSKLEPHIEWRAPVDERHAATIEAVRGALDHSLVGRAMVQHAGPRTTITTALFYALSPEDLSSLGGDLGREAVALTSLEALGSDLAAEVRRLREQLATLRMHAGELDAAVVYTPPP